MGAYSTGRAKGVALRRTTVILLAWSVLAGALVMCAGAVAARDATSATVVKVAFNKTIKRPIVVDGRGLTLYMFTADTAGTPNCTAALTPACPKVWPALKAVGGVRAGNGIVASKLTTVKRSDTGVTQVVYNRHPLYYYRPDKKPGDAKGQGFSGLWYVLSPKGTSIRR
jgi:predicted lipoprotein with Yx(FWY)xxD motif